MNKTKILAIAPYEGLREVIITEAASRDDVVVDVFLGDLANGVDIAQTLEKTGYDIILSRGGTATLIEHVVNLPVIDIAPSVYDLLRFIRMAENIPGRFAVVGFYGITHTAEKIFDLIKHTIQVVTLDEQSNVEEVITQLIQEGVTLIVGDAIAVSTAKKLRLNSILIASGHESVHSAFNDAVRLNQVIRRAMQRNLLFKTILDQSNLSVVVFDSDKNMLYSNLSQDQMENPRVFRSLPEYVPTVLKEGELNITRHSKGYLFEITGQKSMQQNGDCVVFYIQHRNRPPQLKNGVVEYYHMLDANRDDSFLSIDNIGQMASVMGYAQKFGKTSSPIVVSGSIGTPFDDVIHMLYQESPFSSHPIYMIDCMLIDQKSFLWILDSEDSPLYESGITICLKNFSSLDEEQQLSFVRYAECTYLNKRNRLIFCVRPSIAFNDVIARFFTDLECLTIRIPALKERPKDIVVLANLYLSMLNVEHGRQAIGFDEAACQLISDYDWPGNNDQIKRFVKQCLLFSNSNIITATVVQTVIDDEKQLTAVENSTDTYITGTLEEINARVAQAVLRDENMNRKNTAERLGISRSTLWRMLKESNV